MSSATETVTRAAFAGIANANDAPRRTSQPVRSASAQRMLIPTGMGAGSDAGRVLIEEPPGTNPSGLMSVRDGPG